jgi:hypothetical protein
MINKYLYFATGDDADASGEAVMLPAANLTGMDIQLDDELDLFFKKVGDNHSTDVSTISLIHDVGASTLAMKQVASGLCANPKDGFIVIADTDKSGTTHGKFFSEAGENVITDAEISL